MNKVPSSMRQARERFLSGRGAVRYEYGTVAERVDSGCQRREAGRFAVDLAQPDMRAASRFFAEPRCSGAAHSEEYFFSYIYFAFIIRCLLRFHWPAPMTMTDAPSKVSIRKRTVL